MKRQPRRSTLLPYTPPFRPSLVGAGGGVVDRGHVDGDRVGGLIRIDAAVERAAIVIYLEPQPLITCASVAHRGIYYHQTAIDFCNRHKLAISEHAANGRQRA